MIKHATGHRVTSLLWSWFALCAREAAWKRQCMHITNHYKLHMQWWWRWCTATVANASAQPNNYPLQTQMHRTWRQHVLECRVFQHPLPPRIPLCHDGVYYLQELRVTNAPFICRLQYVHQFILIYCSIIICIKHNKCNCSTQGGYINVVMVRLVGGQRKERRVTYIDSEILRL